eukprot:SAG22_NODE_12303_length_448_cov_0.739255_1_plen_59_part_10
MRCCNWPRSSGWELESTFDNDFFGSLNIQGQLEEMVAKWRTSTMRFHSFHPVFLLLLFL